jgi:NAD(P)-dependent dehydrogenase (short-subunit alcohol dehydrogenase family)
METNSKNKVAVITGASRGIGRAIAERLSAEGMKLVLAARSINQLNEVIEGCATEARAFPVDLRQENSPTKLIEFAVEKFGRIDVLVNNAGATKRGDFLELSEEDWTDGFALKFFGTVRCSRAAWPFLMESRGAIVNIIGIGGRTGSAEFAIGGSVNAALMNLTKVLADRGINDGVKVNAINPGTITTERLKTRINKFATDRKISEDLVASEMAKKLGVSRFGTPDEIASAVAFFASNLSSYCQGTIIDIDGGQTRTL